MENNKVWFFSMKLSPNPPKDSKLKKKNLVISRFLQKLVNSLGFLPELMYGSIEAEAHGSQF